MKILSKPTFLEVIPLFIGLIFGLGLILSGMVNPEKVLGFLDVFGNWDPSLVFVMVGALFVSVFAFKWVKQHKKTLFNQLVEFPEQNNIDKKIVLGSIAFGVGWGISGICPGPAVILVGTLSYKGLCFFVSMLFGFATYQFISND